MTKFRKLTLSTALLCATGAAHAELSVSTGDVSLKMYGFIDTGVAMVTNSGNGHQTQTAAEDSILGVSNLGFSGSYTMDEDMSAIFNLQAGFDPSTGQEFVPGTIFSRNAYVGIKSASYGTFTMGKQWDFNDDWLVGSVFLGGYNSGCIFKFSEFDAVSEIFNKTIKYTSPDWNGFQYGALYGFGDGVGNGGKLANLAMKYTNGPLMIGGTYYREEDEDTGTTYAKNNYQLTTVGGRYNFGLLTARLGASYADISGQGQFQSIPSLSKRKAYATEAGVDYQFTPKLTLSGDVLYRKNTTLSNQSMVYRFLGAYQIWKPLSLILNVAYLTNSDGATESLDNTDSGLSGGGYPNRSQLSTAVGVRFVF